MRKARKVRVYSTNIVIHVTMTTVRKQRNLVLRRQSLAPERLRSYSDKGKTKIRIAQRVGWNFRGLGAVPGGLGREAQAPDKGMIRRID